MLHEFTEFLFRRFGSSVLVFPLTTLSEEFYYRVCRCFFVILVLFFKMFIYFYFILYQIYKFLNFVFIIAEAQIVNKFGGGPEAFQANKPFIFYIQDEAKGTLLFSGKITDPTKE